MSYEGIENLWNPRLDPVEQQRLLTAKALKCIEVARRMLPGAADLDIEVQAADLMYLPDKSIDATLERQLDLGKRLATTVEEPIIGRVEGVREMARRIQWRNDE